MARRCQPCSIGRTSERLTKCVKRFQARKTGLRAKCILVEAMFVESVHLDTSRTRSWLEFRDIYITTLLILSTGPGLQSGF